MKIYFYYISNKGKKVLHDYNKSLNLNLLLKKIWTTKQLIIYWLKLTN